VRAEVEREQLRLPLAYFTGELRAPPGWTVAPAAYLAFGGTYAAERARAGEWGWPVRTLPGLHLHMLADPAAVADAIEELRRLAG
jgi:hypothetical protein